LRDPRVRQRLDGVEPARTLLAFDSLRALRREPSADATAIPIANALNADEMTGSAVARNTRQRRPAADRNRQPVTRRGRRDARADQMAGLRPDRCVSAPQGHQRTRLPAAAHRPFARRGSQARAHATRQVGGDAVREICAQRCATGELTAILLHLALWHMDLAYFGRGLLGSWPQTDIGIVLWSLSVSAGDWQSSEKLTRLCTIPEPAMLSGTWDRTPYAMEARILRPLLWFGLLEHRSEKISGDRFGELHF
jgi:hypothetical protein